MRLQNEATTKSKQLTEVSYTISSQLLVTFFPSVCLQGQVDLETCS
jgi:hypothetical protein